MDKKSKIMYYITRNQCKVGGVRQGNEWLINIITNLNSWMVLNGCRLYLNINVTIKKTENIEYRSWRRR